MFSNHSDQQKCQLHVCFTWSKSTKSIDGKAVAITTQFPGEIYEELVGPLTGQWQS